MGDLEFGECSATRSAARDTRDSQASFSPCFRPSASGQLQHGKHSDTSERIWLHSLDHFRWPKASGLQHRALDDGMGRRESRGIHTEHGGIALRGGNGELMGKKLRGP
jgi:hypothetical protein